MIIIPRKGSLPLSSSSIVKLSEECISFSVNKNSEADETSGIFIFFIFFFLQYLTTLFTISTLTILTLL